MKTRYNYSGRTRLHLWQYSVSSTNAVPPNPRSHFVQLQLPPKRPRSSTFGGPLFSISGPEELLPRRSDFASSEWPAEREWTSPTMAISAPIRMKPTLAPSLPAAPIPTPNATRMVANNWYVTIKSTKRAIALLRAWSGEIPSAVLFVGQNSHS